MILTYIQFILAITGLYLFIQKRIVGERLVLLEMLTLSLLGIVLIIRARRLRAGRETFMPYLRQWGLKWMNRNRHRFPDRFVMWWYVYGPLAIIDRRPLTPKQIEYARDVLAQYKREHPDER